MLSVSKVQSAGAYEELRRRIFELPKIDLHRHLTGSISASAAIDVARRHRIPLPTFDVHELDDILTIRARPGSLRDYFRPWQILNNLFVSSAATGELVSAVLDDAAADNVAYLELRMAPRFLVSESNLPLSTFIGAVSEVVSKRSFPMTRCILGLPRHSLERMDRSRLLPLLQSILQTIRREGRECFVGVDLNGDESVSDGRTLRWFFDAARNYGLKVSIHAGELGSAENVRVAMNDLGAQRLGHGNAAFNELDLVADIAHRGIALELCPTSNVLLGTIPSIAALPIYLMRQMDIRYTINTDNPARCGITLSDELYNIARTFDLQFDDIIRLSRAAMEVSFLGASQKLALLRRFYGEAAGVASA